MTQDVTITGREKVAEFIRRVRALADSGKYYGTPTGAGLALFLAFLTNFSSNSNPIVTTQMITQSRNIKGKLNDHGNPRDRNKELAQELLEILGMVARGEPEPETPSPDARGAQAHRKEPQHLQKS